MRSDATGLAHGTTSAAAVACLDRLRDELLVYGLDAAVVFEAVRIDPDFAAARALAAALHLLALSPEGQAAARPLARDAMAGRHAAPPRERLLIEAIACWAAGNEAGCRRRLSALVQAWPTDLVAARLLQVHQLNCGNFRAMRAMTALLVDANPGVSHVGGMHAFALAETGAVQAAERFGRAAADAAFDPWAEHAVAHVFAARRDPRAAIAWLQPRGDRWARCSSFLYTHNWWHVALALLALGEGQAALELFDRRVWAVRKDYAQDQLNAVSLLARLQLAGVEVGERWAELAGWLAPRAHEHLNGFLDLHLLLGLARAGRDGDVAAMRASLAAKARTSSDEIWRDIVPTLADGIVAHARRRWEAAARLLGRALPRLPALGGSSVQRDLFVQLHADAQRAPG